MFKKLLLLLLTSVLSFAQSTGLISGTVADPTGALIPGAKVVSINVATGSHRTVQTNPQGIFVFPDLPIGEYSVEISSQGFTGEKREGISLLTGQTIDLNFSLKMGASAQSVEVNEGSPLIQTESSSVQTSVNEKRCRICR